MSPASGKMQGEKDVFAGYDNVQKWPLLKYSLHGGKWIKHMLNEKGYTHKSKALSWSLFS